MVSSIEFIGIPHLWWVESPELAFVQVLRVTRNDKVVDWDGTTPTGAQMKYIHNATTGRVSFSSDIPFTVTGETIAEKVLSLEKIKVIYKI
jgi:hypothetical protein